MSVINTNYLALVSQNNLTKSQNALGSAIERLSSGLRINSAKDDAAGQAIANRFTANIKGLTQATRNANDGISIAQTTEGALNEINNNLQRIRELTVQAQNGSNSADDRQSIQAEIRQRLDEINRVSEQTQFNGVKVLSRDNTMKIQVGAHDSETIDINLQEITTNSLGLSTYTVAGPQRKSDGTLDPIAAKQLTDVYGTDTKLTTGDIQLATTTTKANVEAAIARGLSNDDVTVDASKVALGTGAANHFVDSNGQWFVKATVTVTGDDEAAHFNKLGFTQNSDGKTALSDGDEFHVYLAVDGKLNAAGTKVEYDLAESGYSAGSLLDGVGSTNPLAQLDKALNKVDSLRSDLGAIQNRFQSTITNLNNTITNLSAARSRIEDADYAVEVSNMTRAQILQQAGTSVLAQANQVPQGVLSLLR